jgi:hypothetical protein
MPGEPSATAPAWMTLGVGRCRIASIAARAWSLNTARCASSRVSQSNSKAIARAARSTISDIGCSPSYQLIRHLMNERRREEGEIRSLLPLSPGSRATASPGGQPIASFGDPRSRTIALPQGQGPEVGRLPCGAERFRRGLQILAPSADCKSAGYGPITGTKLVWKTLAQATARMD